MADVDEYEKALTSGSMIYGMLVNNIDPEQLFFIDSSPFDTIDSPRKLKRRRLPVPKQIRLSIADRLDAQVKAYKRTCAKRRTIKTRYRRTVSQLI